jgi:hypothetical protein
VALSMSGAVIYFPTIGGSSLPSRHVELSWALAWELRCGDGFPRFRLFFSFFLFVLDISIWGNCTVFWICFTFLEYLDLLNWSDKWGPLHVSKLVLMSVSASIQDKKIVVQMQIFAKKLKSGSFLQFE